ncbi:MAG: sensor domain-containing diguanylate cyclase [Tepidimonas sp.]|uniref:sensor domain-containing diguanylate cyclase n=1 Tax=Tepidimonas sp. TaxID=2002775 RepID=UPI004054C59C
MSDCCPVTVSPLVAWPHADWLALAGVGRWWWHVPSGAARYDAGWKRQVGLPERAQIDTVTAWRERLHPDDVSEVDSQLAAVLRPGGRDRYEAVFRLRHADGDYRWIHSGGRVASRDETGAAQWLVGTHQDVTREMQQARIAQRDEAWLQALDQVVGGFRFVIVYRPDGSIQRIERISDSVVTLCGLTPETLIAAPERLWEYVLPQDRERIAQTVCDTIQARGTVLRIDYRMDRGTADATAPRWMRAVAIGEYMGEDGLSRWYGCALDITESVEQSERLATALNDLDATLKAIPDLCFVIDEQGYYRQVWAPTPELLLVPPAQIVGKRPRDVLPPALLGLVESGMAHAKDSGAPQEIRYTLRLGERLHHFEARIVVRQHGPHFGGYVCLVRDVTDLAQAQNEREQLLLRDRLTGHWNRAGLFDRGFAEWVSQHERGGGPLEILIVMADIDGLRELNHALGHAAGDRLIQTVAQRIADAAPAGLLARIGGDEIVLFAPARRDGDRARAALRRGMGGAAPARPECAVFYR